jgi:hypothetical protein
VLIIQHKLKKIFLYFGALFCVTLAAQDQQLLVAVLDPVSNQNVSSIVKMAVTGTLEEHIVRSKKYRVVDRVRIAQILTEYAFAKNGLVDNNQVKEIGKMLQADIVCVSELLQEEGVFLAKCSFINVESSEVVASATEIIETNSAIEIKSAIERAAMKLLGVENPREAQAREQAIKELAERKLREQQEQADRERRIKEQAARENEARAQAEREREAREHEQRLRAIREAAREPQDLAAIAKDSIKPATEDIKAADDVEAAKTKIEKLKKNFKISTDEFTKTTTYIHKDSVSLVFPVLHAGIAGDHIFVVSIHTQKAIRPNSIIVIIDDEVTSFKSIMADSHYTSLGRNICELTTFAFLDNSLVRLIASHPQKEMRIRLSGSTGNVDFTLPKKYHQSICDTVELFDALQIVKNGGKP